MWSISLCTNPDGSGEDNIVLASNLAMALFIAVEWLHTLKIDTYLIKRSGNFIQFTQPEDLPGMLAYAAIQREK